MRVEGLGLFNRLLLSLPPGKGDVIASTKDGKFVAERKGGIVALSLVCPDLKKPSN